jgi:putative phosphoesterase
MLIGVISDIHSNVAALDTALRALDGRVDAIWCAGDVVVQYRFSTDAVARLRAANTVTVQGNHDMVAVREGLGDDASRAWLAALPFRHEADIDGTRVLMTHGSPWAPHGDYLRAHNDKWRQADALGADIVIVGHTHEPMAQRFGSTLVVNPGSVGEPRQRDDRRPSYAVLDTTTRSAVIERFTL